MYFVFVVVIFHSQVCSHALAALFLFRDTPLGHIYRTQPSQVSKIFGYLEKPVVKINSQSLELRSKLWSKSWVQLTSPPTKSWIPPSPLINFLAESNSSENTMAPCGGRYSLQCILALVLHLSCSVIALVCSVLERGSLYTFAKGFSAYMGGISQGVRCM